MSKKEQLLTESQVRKFMKLANLAPITPGFIMGLDEAGGKVTPGGEGGKYAKEGGEGIDQERVTDIKRAHLKSGGAKYKGVSGEVSEKMKKGSDAEEDESLGMEDGPERDKKQSEKDRRKEARGEDRADESHGRGKDEGPEGYGKPDQNARSRNENLGLEDEHDLENAEDDLEHADDLEVDADEDLGDMGLEDDLASADGGREVSVDDFLAALEVALEDVLGDEVEVDQEEEEVEDEEVELPLGDEEGLEVGLEVEEEPALQEMINQITRRVAKRIVKEALQGKNKK